MYTTTILRQFHLYWMVHWENWNDEMWKTRVTDNMEAGCMEIYCPVCRNRSQGFFYTEAGVWNTLTDDTTVKSFTSPWQYIREEALAASTSELAAWPTVQRLLCHWPTAGMRAVCRLESSLLFLCDLIQLCPGCFIRWGLSLPRCGVMNCLSLRSRWSQSDDGRLGRPCRGVHAVISSARNRPDEPGSPSSAAPLLMWNGLWSSY